MNPTFFDFDKYELPELSNFQLSEVQNPTTAVILNHEDYENQKDLLHKILESIEIKIEDILLCKCIDNNQYHLQKTLPNSIKSIFVFGINPALLSLNASFRAYHVYQTENYNILFNHSLNKLAENRDYKKALWAVLQFFKS